MDKQQRKIRRQASLTYHQIVVHIFKAPIFHSFQKGKSSQKTAENTEGYQLD